MNKYENEKRLTRVEGKYTFAKLLTGLFIIFFGTVLLLDQLDIEIPKIFRSWELILIFSGIVLLVKHSMKSFSAYVLILIGCVFLLRDYYPDLIKPRIIWPSLIILVGVYIVLKTFQFSKKKDIHNPTADWKDSIFESSSIFGSINKKIYSKNFVTGSVSAIFAGIEIDFTQANIEESASLDIGCFFSGVTIVLPPEWEIKSEVSSIFGGVEDKRMLRNSEEISKKILILKGTCMFGGIDLSNHSKRR
ncbi:MAG: hypothetical protein HYU67_03275 [Flavobacteriia bacterium]|nr:hypothetical protein [Flavobacteriia bacterium]